MKKIALLFCMMMISVVAFADVTVTVTWTPASDPGITGQQVVYDPDQAVGGDDVIIATLAAGVGSHSFTRVGNDGPDDAVRIDTQYGATTVPSNAVSLVCVQGATVTTVTQTCN